MFRHSLSRWIALALLAALPLVFAACAAHDVAPTAADAPPEPPSIVGETSRDAVQEAEPTWMAMEVDAEAAAALAEVEPGAEVVVFFGTWCSDSRRELSRLWRAFDEAGLVDESMLPFAIEYVAVDREKMEPAERTAGMGIRYVPTFIVYRDGSEVGRMVEVSPNGIEHDLLALLTGEASGVVSARDDLGASSGGH